MWTAASCGPEGGAESQAASALDHPNICTIHEIDSTPEGQMFIAMAFYDGETLKRRIDRGPLPLGEALDIARQVAQGLMKAHAAGIVHRDIKPANVMVTRDGFVKIVDFGIAKLLGVTGSTQAGSTLGTVSYMSPEQVAGEDADPRSDVWALGALLYEMLTGQLPFKGENQWVVMNAISNATPAPPWALRPEIPVEVEATVIAALEKDRENRTASAEALRRELDASQALIHFEGLGAFQVRAAGEPRALLERWVDVVRSGRALVVPVWNGSYDRWDDFLSQAGEQYLRSMRTRMAEWSEDLGRTIDYLNTRDDIDAERIAYFGISFGSSTPLPILDLEKRIRAALLVLPGYTYRDVPPEIDAVNYVPRITMPVLMIGGRDDSRHPRTSGTCCTRWATAPSGGGQFLRDVLPWLDEYLGPVD